MQVEHLSRVDVDKIPRPVPSYIVSIEKKVREVYEELLKQREGDDQYTAIQYKAVAEALAEKRKYEAIDDIAARGQGYITLFDRLAKQDGKADWLPAFEAVNLAEGDVAVSQGFDFTPTQRLFVDLDAKLQLMLRQVRTTTTHHLLNKLPHLLSSAQTSPEATSPTLGRAGSVDEPGAVVEMSSKPEVRTPDHFEYVLKRFSEAKIDQKKVEEYFRRNAPASFSITAHPTNPTTVEFSQALSRFERALIQERDVRVARQGVELSDEAESLKASVSELIDVELVSTKNKTPIQELREAIISLNNIYDTMPRVAAALKAAMEKNGYKYRPERLGQMVYPSFWVLGDGDGNTNQNASNLEEGMLILKAWILNRYCESIGSICSLEDETDRAYVDGAVRYIMAAQDNLQILSEEAAIRSLMFDKKEVPLQESERLDLQARKAQVNERRGRFKDTYGIDFEEDAALLLEKFNAIMISRLTNPESVAKVQALTENYKAFSILGPTIDLRHKSTDITHMVARVARKLGWLETEEAEKEFKTSDIEKIIAKLKSLGIAQKEAWVQAFEAIAEKIEDSEYKTKADLIEELRVQRQLIDGEAQLLAVKPQLLGAIDRLIQIVDAQGLSFVDDSANYQKQKLEEWLQRDDLDLGDIRRRFVEGNELCEDEQDKTGVIAERLFRRFDVAARYPGACRKLIIAEMKGAQNGLAALLALKLAGNKVAEEGAQISITPLVESVPDLQRVKHTLESMYENKWIRLNAQFVAEVILQIARSDTTRRSGRGASTVQDAAIQDFYELGVTLAKKYPELTNVLWHCFQGGGFALQRGGGRVEENAAKHTRAALTVGEKLLVKSAGEGIIDYTQEETVKASGYHGKMGRHLLTVQGHQNCVAFGPGSTFNFLEAMIAQNLYSGPKCQGLVRSTTSPTKEKEGSLAFKNGEVKEAADLRDKATEIMRREYLTYRSHPLVIELLKDGPWVLTKTGNASSRAAKRGQKAAPREGDTAVAICPYVDRELTKQRAIGTERYGAHSGLQWLTLIAVVYGLREIDKLDELPAVYSGSKSERDDARVTAIALAMVDFDKAWDMFCYREPPSLEEVKVLSDEFEREYKNKNHAELKEMLSARADDRAFIDYLKQCTLAHFEQQCVELAQLLFKELNNNESLEYDEKVHVHDILRTPLSRSWPDMYNTLRHREQMNEFEHSIENVVTKWFAKHPEVKIPDALREVMLRSYCGADVTNTPSGILSSITKHRDSERWSKLHSVDRLPFACGLENLHEAVCAQGQAVAVF